jgi:alkylation response protein AidB-like acyl-CoA dehydrogenase
MWIYWTYLLMNTTDTTPPNVPVRTAGDPVTPESARFSELLGALATDAFERERDDVAAFAAMDLVRRYGFGAFRVPRELGGGGASLRQLIDAVIELAAIDPNVIHALRSHFIFVDARLAAFDRGEQSFWLSEVLEGALFGNATTELGNRNTGGLDTRRFSTTLTPDGDGYLLNGEKFYSTGSLFSDWVSVAAVTPEGEVASATIPVAREGVHIADDWDGIGQRLTASGSSRFVDVRVEPAEVALRHGGGEFARHGATLAQLWLTAVAAGILQAAARDAASILRGRSRTFSHGSATTAADDPLLQQVVGQLATNAFTARSVVMTAADSLQAVAEYAGEAELEDEVLDRARIDCAMAKVAVDGLAERAGWQLFDVGGASATRRGLNLDRHWRNARTLASHNPSLYKTRALGDRLVNDAPLPASNLF